MSSYNLYGTAIGNETVYEYTRRRWNELRNNFKVGKSPGVSNNKDGAYAASRLIYVEMKKNPGIVTDEIPPSESYIESYINNPTNPITWVSQKSGQAAQDISHTIKVNLDKPAEALSRVGDAMPWYVKPGAIVGILAAAVILPPLFGSSIEAIMRKGFRGGKRK